MNTDLFIHPSIQGLVQFIASQPKEAHIEHTGGWASCALGDYLKSVGTPYNVIKHQLVPSQLLVEEMSLVYGGDVAWKANEIGFRIWEKHRSTTLMGWLNNPPRESFEHGNTYGDLQQLIRTMPHLQQFI